MDSDSSTRLNKYLAHTTGISRREADEFIEQGKVRVDGTVVNLGAQFDPTRQSVSINGHPVSAKRPYTYLLMHKPVGYVCSRKQQGYTLTIYSILPPKYHDLKPVGRLDKDSSGLLLLTDDGDFAHQMTHPKFHKAKTYQIALDKPLTPLHRQMISDHGIILEDGPSKLQLERLKDGNDTEWIVNMHEGRNRQIRRTFFSLGYEVTRLHRTQFGTYSLGDLKPNELRIIKP